MIQTLSSIESEWNLLLFLSPNQSLLPLEQSSTMIWTVFSIESEWSQLFFLSSNESFLPLDRSSTMIRTLLGQREWISLLFLQTNFSFPRSILDDDLKTHLDRKCVKVHPLCTNESLFVFQIQPRQRSKHSRRSKVIGIDFSLCRWNLFVF